MVDRVKGDGRAVHPPPSPAWADFTIMMECTPESDHDLSVCTLWGQRSDRMSPQLSEVSDIV